VGFLVAIQLAATRGQVFRVLQGLVQRPDLLVRVLVLQRGVRAVTYEEECIRKGLDLMAEARKLRVVPRAKRAPVGPKKKTIRYRERVAARLGKGGKPRDAIVTIDKAQTLRIRPFRGRKVYEMSMEQAVAWLMQKLVVPTEVGRPRRRRRS